MSSKDSQVSQQKPNNTNTENISHEEAVELAKKKALALFGKKSRQK